MAKPAETPGEIVLVPVIELGTMMADSWRRSGCRESSPLLLGLRERRARVLGVEGGEKEKQSNVFEGRGREIFGMWYREEGEVANLSLPTASYSKRENEVQQLKNNYLIRTK